MGINTLEDYSGIQERVLQIIIWKSSPCIVIFGIIIIMVIMPILELWNWDSFITSFSMGYGKVWTMFSIPIFYLDDVGCYQHDSSHI